MEKKKIWVVTELFHPEETAVAYIFTRIADQLSNDYDVRVISGPEFYDKHKADYKDTYQLSEDIAVYRAKTLHLDKNSLIQRSLKIIILSLNMSFLVLKKVTKGDTVLLATNPAPLLVLMSLVKRWKKIQLHILVHDVFPENTIPAGVFKTNKSILYKLLKAIFDRAYAKADHLLVIGRDMKEVLINKTDRFRHKPEISIVTNWSKPTSTVSTFANKDKASERKYQKAITLQYAGNIGRTQALDVLLDSFGASNNPDLHLKIRGTGALTVALQNQIQLNNIKNVTLSGGYSRDEENTILSECDIAIVSLSSGMYGLGVPSKTYNLLTAGKPILFIGDPDSEISLMVKEYEIGWSIDVNKKTDLVDFFRNLNPDDKNDFEVKGQKARLLAETLFEEKRILAQFQKQMEANFKD